MKIRRRNYKGFTFLESIISVFVLSFGIVAVLPLVSNSLKESADSRDQIITSFLAQEGIELVENIRDNNWAVGDETFDNTTFPGNNKQNCRIDYTSGGSDDIKNCNNSNDGKVLRINGNGFYEYSSGTETKFQRRVDVEYFDSGGGSTNRNNAQTARITSVVSWGASGLPDTATTVDADSCNTSTQCAYAQVVLAKWH